MQKILKQEEIDQLFRAAQGAQSKTSISSRHFAKECDFRQAGQLTKDMVRQLTLLHEPFAPSLANSLGAYLRVGFQTSLVAVEQLAYGDLLGRLPEQTYLATIHLHPLEELAAFQLDLSVIFPIIDLLLGGPGQSIPESRDLTEIEEQILESIVVLLCRELQNTWQGVLPIKFQMEERLKQSQIVSLMTPGDRVLNLSFEIRLKEVHGSLNLIFPTAVSNMLLRKLAQQGMVKRRRPSADDTARLRERVLGSKFTIGLELPHLPLHIRQVVNLEPGQILPLGRSVDEPVFVTVNGLPVFNGVPVSCGAVRGGLIQSVLPPPQTVEEEHA